MAARWRYFSEVGPRSPETTSPAGFDDDDVVLGHDAVVERGRGDGDVAVLHPGRDVARGALDEPLLEELFRGGDDYCRCVFYEGHGPVLLTAVRANCSPWRSP